MRRLGRYVVEREIGRGVMGVVWLARDPRVGRPVALKTIRLPEALDPERRREFLERFLREARAAGSLSHSGIVTVYDVDRDPETGTPFIAMEYVRGSSLKEILDGGPLALDRVAEIGTALADALGEAHAAGTVHRDVKPANVLITETDGRPKLVDFGVARLPASDLTRERTAIGSPAYMSPEAVRGGEVDGRSDLFSLAVVLFEAVTGRRPFEGEDLGALAYAVAHTAAPPPSALRPGVPEAVDRFFARALAKEPTARFADAAAFRDALVAACRAPGRAAETVIEPPAARPAPRLPRRARLAVVAVLGLAGVLWLAFARPPTYLLLEGRSSVEAGTLHVLVDGEEVYRRPLAAPRPEGAGRRALRRFLHVGQESFEDKIRVRPGLRTVTAKIESDFGEDAESSVVVDLGAGESHRVRLVAGTALGSPLSLKAD